MRYKLRVSGYGGGRALVCGIVGGGYLACVGLVCGIVGEGHLL
jgi:hypothetical protein